MAGAVSEDLPDVKEIAYLLARFACNNHTVYNEELHPIGTSQQFCGTLLLTCCSLAVFAFAVYRCDIPCDMLNLDAGIGIYPQGAMLNHSCTPNAVQSFDGKRIVFRAVAPIPAGHEAAIAYVELAALRPERRDMLKRHYCFDIDAQQARTHSWVYSIIVFALLKTTKQECCCYGVRLCPDARSRGSCGSAVGRGY